MEGIKGVRVARSGEGEGSECGTREQGRGEERKGEEAGRAEGSYSSLQHTIGLSYRNILALVLSIPAV